MKIAILTDTHGGIYQEEARQAVKVGSVTFAVRSTSIDGFDLNEGDIIGLSDKNIIAKGERPEAVAEEIVDKLTDEDVSTITIYYGYKTTEEEANALMEKIAEKYPDCDVDAHNGGQALYYYIIALE